MSITIPFNSKTYDRNEPNENLCVTQDGTKYTEQSTKSKKSYNLKYKQYDITTSSILYIYPILQHIFGVATNKELSELDWDYTHWHFKVTNEKKLSNHDLIFNVLLNLGDKFNTPISIDELEKKQYLTGRGWGGERPREIYYKYGFPLYTPSTKKTLKKNMRQFECPFPICSINPFRKAIVKNSDEKKCFTCGCKDGDINIFGHPCKFEKGHLDPHINGGNSEARYQCKQCNSFYKDKITWDTETGKPTFNTYAILRDAPKKEIIKNMKILGFTAGHFQ